MKTKVFADLGNIGAGFRHIAGLHGQEHLIRLASQKTFQSLNHAHELNRAVIADIIDFVRW